MGKRSDPLDANVQSIVAADEKVMALLKPPSFEMLTVVVHAGHTRSRVTLAEFVYRAPLLILTPTAPDGETRADGHGDGGDPFAAIGVTAADGADGAEVPASLLAVAVNV